LFISICDPSCVVLGINEMTNTHQRRAICALSLSPFRLYSPLLCTAVRLHCPPKANQSYEYTTTLYLFQFLFSCGGILYISYMTKAVDCDMQIEHGTRCGTVTVRKWQEPEQCCFLGKLGEN
jgi:hypothetical protein